VSWVGDVTWCDEECMNPECDFDGGDCGEYCDEAEDCPWSYMGDDWCDEECLIEECGFDWGDCDEEEAGSGCYYDYTEWGAADCNAAYDEYGVTCEELESEEYNWDCEGCSCIPGDYCAEGCPWDWVGDVSWCDEDCMNEDCYYDGGDCGCAFDYTA